MEATALCKFKIIASGYDDMILFKEIKNPFQIPLKGVCDSKLT